MVTRLLLTLQLSSNCKNLSTDKELAHAYVLALSQLEGVTAVNVGGSRSPKSADDAHAQSDWDFHVMMANPHTIPQPSQWGLHGEAHSFASARKKDVQVWPDDEHGLIT